VGPYNFLKDQSPHAYSWHYALGMTANTIGLVLVERQSVQALKDDKLARIVREAAELKSTEKVRLYTFDFNWILITKA